MGSDYDPDDDRVIQLQAPAHKLEAVYLDGDGSTFREEVVALGLTKSGGVRPLAMCIDGTVSCPADDGNFVCYMTPFWPQEALDLAIAEKRAEDSRKAAALSGMSRKP